MIKKSENKIFEIETINSGKEKNILCTAPLYFLEDIKNQLEEKYNVIYAFRAKKSEVKLLLENVHGWIVDPGADYLIDKELLKFAKNLEILVTPSTGRDHIDRGYLKTNGVFFDGLKGKEEIINDIHASAEFSFALLLAMTRHLVDSVNSAQQGFWREFEDDFRGIEISGKTIGLIGYGRIGKKMTTYSLAFGAKVLIYDPYVKLEHTGNVSQVEDISVLLKESDIVSTHVHLDDETLNMFREEHFNLMKKGSYFLNTARGAILDEAALLNALKKGHLAGAAVDVIIGEQSGNLYNHEIIKYARNNPNLIVSPHIAGLTTDSQGKAAQFSIDTINNFYKEKDL